MEILPIFRTYKIPIVLGGISLLAIVLSIVLLVQSIQTAAATPIRFSSDTNEASGSTLGASAIVVDVEGAVAHAGVYTLPAGSRVDDALASAGGLGSDADEDLFAKTFNRAAKITDGAKIYIPKTATDQTPHNSSDTQNGLVSVNFSSTAQLDVLPGVGPVTAQKIIDNRPYQTLDELVTKKAIGASLYEKLKNSLSL